RYHLDVSDVRTPVQVPGSTNSVFPTAAQEPVISGENVTDTGAPPAAPTAPGRVIAHAISATQIATKRRGAIDAPLPTSFRLRPTFSLGQWARGLSVRVQRQLRSCSGIVGSSISRSLASSRNFAITSAVFGSSPANSRKMRPQRWALHGTMQTGRAIVS